MLWQTIVEVQPEVDRLQRKLQKAYQLHRKK